MPVDSEKNRARVKQWRKDNPERHRAQNSLYKQRHPEVGAAQTKRKQHKFRECLAVYKITCGCMDCGEHFMDHPECLDLDHRPGEIKLFDISKSTTRSLALVIAEAEKCDVVCSNCHRIRTMARKKEK